MFCMILGWILMLVGCFFLLSSAFGCLKFSDFYMKIHAASVGDSLGIPLILCGTVIQNGFSQFSLKIVLLLIFMFITNPASCHALAKSAFISASNSKRDTIND